MAADSRVVLVTGASSGLGAAIAEACAAAGYRVALAARRVERLQEVAQRINRPGDTLVIPANMRDPESIREMAAATEGRFGRIDALVANAGVGHGEPFVESSEEHLLDQMEVNVLGVIRCARQALPGMLARRSGHILTVASVAAEIPSAGSVLYGATKGAVVAFSEGLRRELLGTGVHVTTILPGFIRSEMTADVPMRMPPASIVGDLVVRLLRRPRPRAVIPRYYGGAIWLNRFAPRLVDWLLVRSQADLERKRQP
jgi:short-subunit dehydrogenase